MDSMVTAETPRWVTQGRVRGGGALQALRGGPVGPPLAGRRWPWAVFAGVLGALAGAATVVALRALMGRDAPDAQEPAALVAVVDRVPVA